MLRAIRTEDGPMPGGSRFDSRSNALADVLSPLYFSRELFHVGVKCVASRYDSYRFAAFDNRNVADPVFIHHL